jgi:flagella basal body P-ring formation protein FlgA
MRISPVFFLLTFALHGNPISDQSCVAVDFPLLTAGDLAQRLPAFGRLPAEQRLGFAPDPGLRRILPAAELNRWLASAAPRHDDGKASGQNQPLAVEHGLCVVRRSRTITPEETLASIRGAFAGRDVEIEVLELSKRMVAAVGTLRFSLNELPLLEQPRKVSTNPGIAIGWNGWFIEPDGRKRPVWARVRLKEKSLRAVTQKDVAAGERLSPENIRQELRESFPWTAQPPPNIEDLYGRAPRVPLLAGELVHAARLVELPAIRKGDAVILEAVTPHTRLAVEGKAASTAYRGQTVSIVTALSKKAVQAVASGEGRATIAGDGSREAPATRDAPAKGQR